MRRPRAYYALREWWRRTFGDYARAERVALPDGTRVRLVCGGGRCTFKDHEGVWRTSWTPRRMHDVDGPDDYMLTREGDGETTYAARDAVEPIA